MYDLETYMKFIEDANPKFRKLNDGFEMFTVSTQHIKGNSIQELLDEGIYYYKKYNGKSPIRYFLEKLEEMDE